MDYYLSSEVEKLGMGWYPVDGIAWEYCEDCNMACDPCPVPIQDVDANGDVIRNGLCIPCYEKRMLRIQDAKSDAKWDHPEESDVRDQT